MYIITKFTKGMFLAQTNMGESSVGLKRFAAFWIVPGAKCHWALSKPSLTSSRMKHRARHVAAHQLCVHTHTGRKRQYCPWDPASGRKRTCEVNVKSRKLHERLWCQSHCCAVTCCDTFLLVCLHMSKQCLKYL